jgi:phage terminase large subunit-like protein
MVENTIRTVRNDKDEPIAASIPYKAVNATRGKYTRAEPISSLYVHNQIHHVGAFADLETQMCNWVPGEQSPDRMDAMVWAFTELFFGAPEQESGVMVYEETAQISPY